MVDMKIATMGLISPGGTVRGPESSTPGTVTVFGDDEGREIKEPDGPISCAGQNLINVGADQTAFNPASMSSVGASIGQIPTAIEGDAVEWADAASGAVPEVRTLYVGKHGADGNNGTSIGVAKLTMASAVAAAAALTPTQGAPVVVRVVDAGVYSGAVTLPAWVSLDAANAIFTSGSGHTIEANDGGYVRAREVRNGNTNQAAIQMASTATGVCQFDIDQITVTGFASGAINRSTTGRMRLTCKRMDTEYRGVDSANLQDTVVDIGDISLNASNASGMRHANGGVVNGRVQNILKSNVIFTGTSGIIGGSYSLSVVEIDADTAWSISFGSTLNLLISKVTGAQSGTGTQNVTIAGQVPPGLVSGPVASTDWALAAWDGTDGDTLQNSAITLQVAGQWMKWPANGRIDAPNGGFAGSQAFGPGAAVGDTNCTAVGEGAVAGVADGECTATGKNSRAEDAGTANGYNARANGERSVASGVNALAIDYSVASGWGCNVNAQRCSLIGAGATATTGDGGVGYQVQVSHSEAMAFGRDAVTTAPQRATFGTVAGLRDKELQCGKGLAVWGSAPPASQPTITGSRGGNAALASLLTEIAATGLVVDGTTA